MVMRQHEPVRMQQCVLSGPLIVRFRKDSVPYGVTRNLRWRYKFLLQLNSNRVLMIDNRSGESAGAEWEIDLQSQHRTEARKRTLQGTEWGSEC